MNKKKYNVRMIVMIGLLAALHIILSRFLSINAWNIKIGFAFAATFTGAYLFGPVGGMLVGGLGDFLGAVLFPIGAYFPGFTLNCALTGLVMGLLLYRKQSTGRLLAAVALDELAISLWITPLWISILYGSPYWPLIISRLPQIGIMLVLETLTIGALIRIMKRINARKLVGGNELTPEQQARKALRSSKIAARNSLTDEERSELSRRITEKIVASEEFISADTIMIYKGYKGEVRLEGLEEAVKAWNDAVDRETVSGDISGNEKDGNHDGPAAATPKHKKTLAYPLCISDTELIPLVPEEDDSWTVGYKGITEPVREKSRELRPEDLDMIICPCTVFDENGGRMGQGGGFYDRYLKNISNTKIALVAFECQKAESILPEAWDRPVDMAYTEERIYRFEK